MGGYNQETVDADWLDISAIGSDYEIQIDANAAPGCHPDFEYRHRRRRFTGQPVAQWMRGLPDEAKPRNSPEPDTAETPQTQAR